MIVVQKVMRLAKKNIQGVHTSLPTSPYLPSLPHVPSTPKETSPPIPSTRPLLSPQPVPSPPLPSARHHLSPPLISSHIPSPFRIFSPSLPSLPLNLSHTQGRIWREIKNSQRLL
ncbi:hypothetical protein Pcinc_027130 [Petrolisthes cinctipes]|uniref:Uncharacterized protein n=1 Tax=Petrolisthes cinctipes TaxID=88211 RepID=A0AAE1F635_PETCI|nr:hypothetical protein Pcinc_027130 [Petrolisthes cinctipes]